MAIERVREDGNVRRSLINDENPPTDGDFHVCPRGEETPFQRFDLPAPINADKVHAGLENGLLMVSAPELGSLTDFWQPQHSESVRAAVPSRE